MALAYTAPTWTDGSGEGISASNLQAISNCIEGLVQGTDKAVHSIAINGSTITLTFADGTTETVSAINLKGISSIAKTSSSGVVDTYTITYSDGTTSTFTVTNGEPVMLEADTYTDAGGTRTFSFSDASITTDGAFDFYADVFGKVPTGATPTTGALTVTFATSDNVTKCRVYVR